MASRVVITTGSRLHFGFFAYHPRIESDHRADSDESPLGKNSFGGIGLMIDSPGIELAASPDENNKPDENNQVVTVEDHEGEFDWCGSYPMTVKRIAEFASRYRANAVLPAVPIARRFELRRSIRSHRGLGSGTQLGLAVAQALAILDGQPAPLETLARRVGRGRRSAIGIHGFARGGFLIDAGKSGEYKLGQLVARADVPEDWRFLLVAPADAGTSKSSGLFGQEEVDALDRLPGTSLLLTERLYRLALLELLPALKVPDVDRFGESLFEFGRLVGEYFKPVQGGIYADERMADLVTWLRQQRIRGIAQTSWGPTIAVCCPDTDSAQALRTRIFAESRWNACRIHIARPLNTGAAIEVSNPRG